MKIAVYQGPSPGGDVEYAFEVAERQLSSAAAADAKLIVFPELFLPGYNQPELHRSMAQRIAGPWERRLEALAAEHTCGIAIGWAESEGADIFNCASCFDEHGKKIAHYRKIQLFGEQEKSTFAFGETYETFTIDRYKSALLICYDVEFAHHVRVLEKQDVELLIVPTANPAAYNYVPDSIVPARAAENGMIIAYANYCGTEGELLYGGNSVIVGPDSAALAKAGKGEVLMVADLDVVNQIDRSALTTQRQDSRSAKVA